MGTAESIMAAAELVAEGQLTWSEAAMDLRDEFDWSIRDLYITGALDRLQHADKAYMARLSAVRLSRVLSAAARK